MHNDLIASIDVGDNTWQVEGSCLNHHVRETLAVAREHKHIRRSQEWSYITLPIHEANARMMQDLLLRLGQHGIEFLLKRPYQHQSYFRVLLIDLSESTDQLIDTFVAHHTAYEAECEALFITVVGCFFQHLFRATKIRHIYATDISTSYDMQWFISDMIPFHITLYTQSFGIHVSGTGTSNSVS